MVKGRRKIGKILPYQRPGDSGSQTIMVNRVMKDLKLSTPSTETLVMGMGGIAYAVDSYKNASNAIGYSFLFYTSEMVKFDSIKYVGINGVKPSKETVKNETYPFIIPVYAVTLKSNTKPNVPVFLDWVTGPEGQEILTKTGCIGI